MTELAPGIHSLGHGKGGHVHAFLLDSGDELSLVDTLFESDARLVLDAIRQLGRSPSDLKRIAITHGHRSHLGGLAALKRASGATVYAHEFPFQLGLWLDYPKHVPCPVDALLDEGDAFGPLQVLHAAGHSPGHLAFAWPERRFLIVGDAVATWPELCPGWHAFNLNKPQHHATLQRLAALDAEIVGVGPATQSRPERQTRSTTSRAVRSLERRSGWPKQVSLCASS